MLMKIADGKDYIPQIKQLLLEYLRRLDRDLSFQNIDAELDDLSAKYTPPNGELFAIIDDNSVLGMAAYHKHSDIRCEMKRLYVTPAVRGLHLGDALVNAVIKAAEKAGYKEMVLDTLSEMKSAIHLYKKYGFEECEPYYNNPMSDVIYMIKRL